MHIYEVAVVGAGPSGIMAAIRAARVLSSAGYSRGRQVTLIERNNSLGQKILLTGQGRCNLTNTASLDLFIEKFGRQGQFLRTAFSGFSNQDLIDFFASAGLKTKIERQGRVFPLTDHAYSVVKVLKKSLFKNKVKILYNRRVMDIRKAKDSFRLSLKESSEIKAKKVILAAGGASFRKTGSTGDGFRLARKLGHTVVPLSPALVPLKVKEAWVKRLQGLALKNIRFTFTYAKRKIPSEIGELMFTHFGLSGPLILDLSGHIVSILKEHKEVRLFIDLKPGLKPDQLENRLLREFKEKGDVQLKNIMKSLLPQNLIPVFIHLSGLKPQKIGSQISQREREVILNLLKGLPLTVNGSLSIDKAMVTSGGISTREINPRTLESKIIPGLYFTGEIIDGWAPSGGYNLQQAFSTGYLAGGGGIIE